MAAPQAIAQERPPFRDELRQGPLRDVQLRGPLSEPGVLEDEEELGPDSIYRPFNEGVLSPGEPLAQDRDSRPAFLDEREDPFAAEPAIAPELAEEPVEGGVEGRSDAVSVRIGAEGAAVDDIVTATVPLATVDALDLQRDLRAGASDMRIGSIETTRRLASDSPFAPVGIRAGTFEFFPALETGIGWTSNADGATDDGEAFFSETVGRFDLRSDWARHDAFLTGYGILRREISGARMRDPEAGLDGELNLDLADGWAGRAAIGFRQRQESATSPVPLPAGVSRPDRRTFSGEIGGGREVGRFQVGLTGLATHETFSNARAADGQVVDQSDRDYTLAALRLRTGYELSAALTPFAEVEAGRRVFDRRRDAAGFERSADRLVLRGGAGFDISEKWRGEASLGWLQERPDDGRLDRISGLELAGNVAWSPLRGTIVDIAALTTVEPATAPGANGSLLYAGSVSITRDIRANLTGTLGLGLDYRDYAATSAYDLTWSGQAALTWWFNRYLGVTGRARHEVLTSNEPGRGRDVTSVFVGLRAQR